MAGLSMGGREIKAITLRNLDKFSHIGLFSGGTIGKKDVENSDGFKDRVELVFVGYGSKEVGGGRRRRGGNPTESVEQLKEMGINARYYLSPDTAHEWQTWRRSLKEFTPLLFQPRINFKEAGYSTDDKFHLDTVGCREFGKRCAAAMLPLLNMETSAVE